MGKAEYVPVTTLSRHFKTHQPRPSGASLCKQAGAGTEVSEEGAPSLSQENTRNRCCSPATGKGLGFGIDLGPGNDLKHRVFSRTRGKLCPSSSWPVGASRQRSPRGRCQVWGRRRPAPGRWSEDDAMGRGSCTVDEPGRPVGARAPAGKVAMVVAGAGAGWSRGAVRFSSGSSPEISAFLAEPWCSAACLPVGKGL